MSNYTIKDIARLAGVSTGTVSRVLNRADNVSPELYKKTMDIVKKTNYLKGKRRNYWKTRMNMVAEKRICLLASNAAPEWRNNSLWMEYLAGVEKACRERNFCLEIQFAAPELTIEELIHNITRSSGVLLKSSDYANELLEHIPSDIPMVGFGAYVPQLKQPQIAVDNRAAGMLATERLLKSGHKHIAFVNPQTSHRMFTPRVEGYTEVMRRTGNYSEEFIIELKNTSPVDEPTKPAKYLPDMSGVLKRILAMKPRPTAIVFANDFSAAGFYRTCEEAEITIPETFSICAMDNTVSICELLSPSLTSVQLPFAKVAEFAAATLIELVAGISSHMVNINSVQYLSGDIVERNSIIKL